MVYARRILGLLAVLLMTIGLAVAVAPGASAADVGQGSCAYTAAMRWHRISQGQPAANHVYPLGQFCLTSGDGHHKVVYQGDGNLVIYHDGRATWSSRTAGHGAGEFIFQWDFNLVIYSKTMHALWSSGTHDTLPVGGCCRCRTTGTWCFTSGIRSRVGSSTAPSGRPVRPASS
jgi:hypothetical protein